MRTHRPVFREPIGTVKRTLQRVVLAYRSVGLDDGYSEVCLAKALLDAKAAKAKLDHVVEEPNARGVGSPR